MQATKTCRDCGGRMAEGFIGDANYGETTVAMPRWHEGVPEKNWLGSLKVDRKAARTIATHRCGRCGILQSYAP